MWCFTSFSDSQKYLISYMGRLSSIIAKDKGRAILRTMHIYIFSHISNIYLMYRLYDVIFFSKPKYFVTLITVARHNFALEVELDLFQLLRLVQLQFSQLCCPLLQVLCLFFSFHTFLSFLQPGEQEPWTIRRKLKGRTGSEKVWKWLFNVSLFGTTCFSDWPPCSAPSPSVAWSLPSDNHTMQCTADLKLLIIMISQITNYNNSSVYWRCHLKFGTAGRHLRYYVRLDSEWCGTFENGIA